ncbi:MAG: hypothetical protein ACK5IJ_11845 [Mangrovibacterium sp.]
MNKNYIAALFIATALFTSCNDENTNVLPTSNEESTADETEKYYLKAKIEESIDLSILQLSTGISDNVIPINFYSNIPDSLLSIEAINENAIFHQKYDIDYTIVNTSNPAIHKEEDYRGLLKISFKLGKLLNTAVVHFVF